MINPVCCREIQRSDLDRVIPLLTRALNVPGTTGCRAMIRLTAPPCTTRNAAIWICARQRRRPRWRAAFDLCVSHTQRGNHTPLQPVELVCRSILSHVRLDAGPASGETPHDATYFNVSPAKYTWQILEAPGFRPFSDGRIVAVPMLSPSHGATKVRAVSADMPGQVDAGADLEQGEITLLLDHADFGCLSLVCDTAEGRQPFVFGLHHRSGVIPVAHLVYCRDLADFVRLARPVGQHLLRRGYGFVILASNGPIEGLVGRYAAGWPRYFKGPDPLRIGDVAYSEEVVFGY